MATQLGFDLPARTALGRDAFMVAPSNTVALAMIDAWENWSLGKIVLTGPTGSGKTHLAHVWAADVSAQLIEATDLARADAQALASGPLAVENVDEIAQNTEAQTVLFHVHNLMQAAHLPLLMTGNAPPNLWGMSLPDLQSRIDAAGHAALNPPDDTLLGAVIAKLFADRQLVPRADVIPYLIPRMERSFAAARTLVAELDAASLAQKKPITRSLAAQVLDKDGMAER